MPPVRLKIPVRFGRIGLIDDDLRDCMGRGGKSGVLHVFTQTPGCALSVNENCDYSVRTDMLAALERLVPGRGPEVAETKALLYGKSLSLPVDKGRLKFGTWQGVYLCPFDEGVGEAEVLASFVASDAASGFTFGADRRASHVLDTDVSRSLPSSGAAAGGAPAAAVALVHEQHTSASLAVSAEGGDLEPGMSRIIPERWNREFFTHTMEGDDDMPGHLKSSLLGCSVALPVEGGSLALGPGQRLFLNEHRDTGGWGGGHSRKVSCVALPASPLQRVSCPAVGEQLRPVTREIESALGVKEGLVTVLVQDPLAGLIVSSRGAAAALTACCGTLAATASDAACAAAIIGCSLVLPVCEGRLVLAGGAEVFVLAPGDCMLVVASTPSHDASH